MSTQELIEKIEATAAALRLAAPDARWISVAPEWGKGIDLPTFLSLCEHYSVDPTMGWNRYEIRVEAPGANFYLDSTEVPKAPEAPKPPSPVMEALRRAAMEVKETPAAA